jgi:hypothetical protein
MGVYQAAGRHFQKGATLISVERLKQLLITAFTDIRTYIALVSLVFAFIAYRRHKRKRLAYEIISNLPLFSVQREIKDRIKIYLDDTLVEKVNLVLIRIYNPGNDAITTRDFESPISVNLGDEAKILSVEISEKSPIDLPANISYDDNSVTLEPLLLNEKDSVTIKALVSRPQRAITVSARIAGVNSIEDRADKDYERARITFGLFQLFAFLIFSSFSLTVIDIVFGERIKHLGINPTVLRGINLIVIVAIFVGVLVFIIGSLKRMGSLKRKTRP